MKATLLCDSCIRGIRSRGESVMVGNIFDPDTGDADVLYCNWCKDSEAEVYECLFQADQLNQESLPVTINPNSQIALIWNAYEVQILYPRLTDEQAMAVLREVERKHDPEMGVTYDTLRIMADEMFPA